MADRVNPEEFESVRSRTQDMEHKLYGLEDEIRETKAASEEAVESLKVLSTVLNLRGLKDIVEERRGALEELQALMDIVRNLHVDTHSGHTCKVCGKLWLVNNFLKNVRIREAHADGTLGR